MVLFAADAIEPAPLLLQNQIMKTNKVTLRVFLIAIPITLLSRFSFADQSPLCDELARFSCAPGSYKDGTGEIKGELEISKIMAGYSEKSRVALHDRFAKVLENPDNEYFEDTALAGLGLKNSPQCTSKSVEDVRACREALIDGLTTMAQKISLGPLQPSTGLERAGNLKDRDYIINNSTYKTVIRDLDDQVQKDLGNPEMTTKLKDKIFPKIKELIVARLNKMEMPDSQKKFLISKVKAISFEGSTCNETSSQLGNADVISSMLVPNAFYNPAQNTFKLCSGFLLQSTSEFQIVTSIAHELTHSIDPCYVAKGPADLGFKYKHPDDLKRAEAEYPIKNLIPCLRSAKSVGAKNFTAERQGQGGTAGPSGRLYGVPSATTTVPGSMFIYPGAQAEPSPPSFCENDQIGESVADWMASEVLPEYIEQNYKLTPEQSQNGYANAYRLGCVVTPESINNLNFGSHPSAEKRINGIILVNPKVRSQMGCSKKPVDFKYCDQTLEGQRPRESSDEAFDRVFKPDGTESRE